MPSLTIEDRLALQDLIAAYSTGDVDALVACFTPDARMIEEVSEDPDIWEGHEGIRGVAEHYRRTPGFPGRQHHVSQIQYFPQDDGSCKLCCFAFVTECVGEPPYLLRFAGWYEDHAVKNEDGQWRFRLRTVRL